MVAGSSLDDLLLVTKRQLLFHGRGIPGRRVFRPALNETFGTGLYLTSDRERAESYATFRTETEYHGEFDLKDIPTGGFQATCYVFEADGLRFLDLRTKEGMKIALPFWREYIAGNRAQIAESAQRYFNQEYRDWMLSCLHHDIDRILQWDETRPMNRYAFLEPQSYLNTALTAYLQSNEFDGLVAIEGSDRDGKLETKKGDSWVVFDPIKLRFVKEYYVGRKVD